jgi:pimeloyl-ACP methyl ester carboxylesterase
MKKRKLGTSSPFGSWVEKAYSKLIYYHKLDKGGHFAASEQPELFVNEMRAALKSLR